MNLHSILSRLCCAALLLVASSASWAAVCPSDPTQTLQASPWTFQLTSGDANQRRSAAVGTFRALPGGILQGVITNATNGNFVSRDVPFTGRYGVYPDCSGGTLSFMNNTYVAQLEFTFASNFNELLLVSTSTAPAIGVLTGFARLAPSSTCPSGISPLGLLDGRTYSFRSYPSTWTGSSSIGTITLSVVNGRGVISGLESWAGYQNVSARLVPISGRYLVNPDCSGGELIVTGRPSNAGSLQLEFFFSKPDYSEILFLNDAPTSLASPPNTPEPSVTYIAGQGRQLTGVCPADPVSVLQASPWGFQLLGSTWEYLGSQATGTFRAISGGVLQVTETYDNNGVVTREGQHGGRYTVYPNCAGGQLTFADRDHWAQIEFVYAGNFDEMYLLTDAVQLTFGTPVLPSTQVGDAKRAPGSCPAGLADPRTLLSGAVWSFRTYVPYQAVIDSGDSAASIGFLTASVAGGASVLSGTETVSFGQDSSPVSRLGPIRGSYQVYGDCSGGMLTINGRASQAGPLQLEFVFAGPNFDDMFLMNASPTGNFNAVAGEAKKY